MRRPSEATAADDDHHGVLVLGDPRDDLGRCSVFEHGFHVDVAEATIEGASCRHGRRDIGMRSDLLPSSSPTACTAITLRRSFAASRNDHSTAASDSDDASTPTTKHVPSSIDLHDTTAS
jgi:hypothetical protein